MDLTQYLLQQAQALQRQLQSLLEKSETTVPASQQVFEATTDLSDMPSIKIGLPEELSVRVPILFGRFHPYFEAGILFSRKQDAWVPVSAFQRGHIFNLTPQETKMEFEFPPMTLTEVKKAKSHVVIRDLGLEEYLSNDKMTALVFSPHPNYLFLMLSELGDPWLKTQIEKAQLHCLLLLSDYV